MKFVGDVVCSTIEHSGNILLAQRRGSLRFALRFKRRLEAAGVEPAVGARKPNKFGMIENR